MESSITKSGRERNWRKHARSIKKDGYEIPLQKGEESLGDADLERILRLCGYHLAVKKIKSDLYRDAAKKRIFREQRIQIRKIF